ncbi:hypothetical protein GQ54DRAFT_40398 [Martensiomyces pterosporus]|nr:hypothetical protein GQ54DRAFT_40398 [Martensiomyces pterosporus]
MKKNTALKFGLNVRKPVSTQAAASKHSGDRGSKPKLKSVFTDDAPDEGTKAAHDPKVFSGGLQSRASERLASDLEATDPSVYAYDEVYDDIKDARGRIKQARKTSDLKPRYMEKLLETAKQRQVQQEMVREKITEKQREKEGSMYEDKETFVTSGYKEQKEERRRLVEEEERREMQEEEEMQRRGARAKSGGLAATGFYKGFLDQMDRDDVSKAVAAGLNSREHISGSADQTNADDRMVSKREQLGAGLNVVSSSTRPRGSGHPPYESAAGSTDRLGQQERRSAHNDYRHNRGLDRSGSSRSSYSQIIEQQQVEQEEVRQKEQQVQDEALAKKYARRNDAAAVEAARQRYLERKRAKEMLLLPAH